METKKKKSSHARIFSIIERRKLRYRPIKIYLSRTIGEIGREGLATMYYYPNRSRGEIIFSLAQPLRRITILGSRSTISYRL